MEFEKHIEWLSQFFKKECERALRDEDYINSELNHKLSAISVLTKLGFSPNQDKIPWLTINIPQLPPRIHSNDIIRSMQYTLFPRDLKEGDIEFIEK